jgi:hypothetical protein
MSDPISISGTAVRVISLGLTVAKGLYLIADGIGSAGREVRMYADEIDSFSKLLNRVTIELEKSSALPHDLQSLLNDVIGICDRVLTPLDSLQRTLKPLLTGFRDSPGKLHQFGLRIQRTFVTKDKLLFYREALQGQHRVLDTTLEIIILRSTRSPESLK